MPQGNNIMKRFWIYYSNLVSPGRNITDDANASKPSSLQCRIVDRFVVSPSSGILRAGLLLLLLPQSQQADAGNLDDLESDTRDITLGLALATETGQQNLVVLVNKVEATVVRNYEHVSYFCCFNRAGLDSGCGRTESSDLLAVLDQLNTNTLSDGRVGLLSLNTNLLQDDSLGVGRATERR